jgi:hypothetical protein
MITRGKSKTENDNPIPPAAVTSSTRSPAAGCTVSNTAEASAWV